MDGVATDLLVAFLWEDRRPFEGVLGLVDYRFAGSLSSLAKRSWLTGAAGERLLVPLTHATDAIGPRFCCILGLGAALASDDASRASLLDTALEVADLFGARDLLLELPGRSDRSTDAADSLATLRQSLARRVFTELRNVTILDSDLPLEGPPPAEHHARS